MLTVLRALNLGTLQQSCTQYAGSPDNNSETENEQIKSALETVAGETGLDKRYLLALLMQESKGCVRAPTTNYGENNPGLFQSFNGQATCNPDNVNFKTPCPESEILAMVREGAGIGRPFGLMQAIEQSGATDDSKYYKGARIYNSGSIASSGNLGDGIATHCYATDIANRLVGWPSDNEHPSACEEGSIGGIQGSDGAYQGGDGFDVAPENPNNDDPSDVAPENPNDDPSDIPLENPLGGHEAEVAPEVPTSGDEPSAPKVEGAAANCKSWYTVKAGDQCSKLPASLDDLRKLNSNLDSTCSNLWLGYAYCVSA